jgi:hypothetical protein
MECSIDWHEILSYLLTPANNTFSNTCPLLVNFVPSSSADTGILKTATSSIVAGLYIGKAPTTKVLT